MGSGFEPQHVVPGLEGGEWQVSQPVSGSGGVGASRRGAGEFEPGPGATLNVLVGTCSSSDWSGSVNPSCPSGTTPRESNA